MIWIALFSFKAFDNCDNLLRSYYITGTRVAPVKKSPSPSSATTAAAAGGGGETNRQRHDSGSSSASEPELEYFNTYSKKLVFPLFYRCILSGQTAYRIESHTQCHNSIWIGVSLGIVPSDESAWCVASTLAFGVGCGHCFGIRSAVDLCRFCVLSLHREVGGVWQFTW